MAVNLRPWMWPHGSAPGAPVACVTWNRFVAVSPALSEMLGAFVELASQKPNFPPAGPDNKLIRAKTTEPSAGPPVTGPPKAGVWASAVRVMFC